MAVGKGFLRLFYVGKDWKRIVGDSAKEEVFVMYTLFGIKRADFLRIS